MIEYQNWACEESALRAYLEALEFAAVSASRSQYKELEKADVLDIDGNTATIHIHGMITPDGPSPIARFFGVRGASYNDISAAADLVAEDPQVERVVLDMSTPGGTVDGVETAYLSLLGVAAKKPLTAVARGQLASAGYWLASAADEIVAVGNSTTVGSIGVAVAVRKPEGVIQIASSNAPGKRPDVTTAKGQNEIRKLLDAMERMFIKAVADGRGVTEATVKEKYGQGAVLVATDPDPKKPSALRNGMIDRVVTSAGDALTETGSTMAGPDLLEEERMDPAELEATLAQVTAERDALKARIDAATPFINSDTYPQAVKDMAVKVLAGDEEASTLRGAVAVFDAIQQKKQAVAAAKDSAEAPEGETGEPQVGEQTQSIEDMLKAAHAATDKA